jgi:hypothetical protein
MLPAYEALNNLPNSFIFTVIEMEDSIGSSAASIKQVESTTIIIFTRKRMTLQTTNQNSQNGAYSFCLPTD